MFTVFLNIYWCVYKSSLGRIIEVGRILEPGLKISCEFHAIKTFTCFASTVNRLVRETNLFELILPTLNKLSTLNFLNSF